MYERSNRIVRRVPPPGQQRRLLTVRRLFALAVIIYLIVILRPHIPFLDKSGPRYTKVQTVCLDPGHGGNDTGATSGSLTERNLNLTVALKVKKLLNEQGYQVFMTRTSNSTYLYNHGRYTYCNNQHATILVAIHQNYFDDPTVDYTDTLYYKKNDQPLAQSLSNAVSTKLQIMNNNISQFDDGVLSKSTMPAALVEGLFMTSSSEHRQITASDSDRMTLEAQGIAQGIMNYFVAPATPKPQGEDVRPGD
jgi:N-acetylmuramoyl-L-alanine amidase